MVINISSKLGGQQINSENPQICGPSANVTLYAFAIRETNLFVICGFKTSTNPQLHTYLFSFQTTRIKRRLLGLF
jgi:hypothetical protein